MENPLTTNMYEMYDIPLSPFIISSLGLLDAPANLSFQFSFFIKHLHTFTIGVNSPHTGCASTISDWFTLLQLNYLYSRQMSINSYINNPEREKFFQDYKNHDSNKYKKIGESYYKNKDNFHEALKQEYKRLYLLEHFDTELNNTRITDIYNIICEQKQESFHEILRVDNLKDSFIKKYQVNIEKIKSLGILLQESDRKIDKHEYNILKSVKDINLKIDNLIQTNHDLTEQNKILFQRIIKLETSMHKSKSISSYLIHILQYCGGYILFGIYLFVR